MVVVLPPVLRLIYISPDSTIVSDRIPPPSLDFPRMQETTVDAEATPSRTLLPTSPPPAMPWISHRKLVARAVARAPASAASQEALHRHVESRSRTLETWEALQPGLADLGACRCDLRGFDCPLHPGKEKWRFAPGQSLDATSAL